MKDFGLALGGGGVKGLAHIALLRKLDELRVKPRAIAGTSMGAIIGALYAAGISGEEIEARVREHIFSAKDGLKKAYQKRRQLVKWVKVFGYNKSRGGLITADGLFEHLFTEIIGLEFSDLKIPFTAVATDFRSGKEVSISKGRLLKAVQASMAVPGIFAPVELENTLLIDGGLVNNVPCDHVASEGRLIIASDVISLPKRSKPNSTQVLSGSLNIMLRNATEQKFSQFPPDFIFAPDTDKIDAFDFHRISRVLDRADEAMSTQSRDLEHLLIQ